MPVRPNFVFNFYLMGVVFLILNKLTQTCSVSCRARKVNEEAYVYSSSNVNNSSNSKVSSFFI